jgi:collagenase-like PrtC family protease
MDHHLMAGTEQGSQDQSDDVQAVAEIVAALRRAGLSASAEELAEATRHYRRNRDGLAHVRARLGPWDPLVATFRAGRESWTADADNVN